MNDLKPCPFCQSTELYMDGCEVVCSTCGARGPDKQVCTDEAIIEAWNKRSHPTCKDCRFNIGYCDFLHKESGNKITTTDNFYCANWEKKDEKN